MADVYSFDIGAKIDLQELDNAINQTLKEVAARYDLKDANAELNFNEKDHQLVVSACDDFKLKAVVEIFGQKLIKRNLSPKLLSPGAIKTASGNSARQEIAIQNGVPKDKAKEITQDIKKMGLKVQTQIQDDQIRVSAKKIDDLQSVMNKLKEKDYGIFFQFVNLR